jgi:hypothetical protein
MYKLILITISILLFCSCAVRSVYVPTSQNVVLFDDKKQIQANAYIGGNHLELQLAHNPVNHFVAGLNINYGTGLSSYEGMVGLYGYSKKMQHGVLKLQEVEVIILIFLSKIMAG